MLRQYNLLALEAFMDIFRLKNQMKNMIYQFLDLLQLSAQEQEEYREDFFAEINSAAYREEYLCCLEEILERLLELSGQSQSPGDKRMDKMLSYIAANYQEDLRLEDLAQEFNFNYHYLSAYFRSRMKEGFSDYLNRLRIEKACELLEDASLSIAQISSLVGYSEHSYFCRVFKKITGETPSVFRRRE